MILFEVYCEKIDFINKELLMKKSSALLKLSCLLLGVVSSYTVQASQLDLSPDINKSIDHINQSLTKKRQSENGIFCPLGVLQTLGLLEPIAEKEIQKEIKSFTQVSNLSKILSQLNDNLINTCKPICNELKSYVFTNCHYTLCNSNLKLIENGLAYIKKSGAPILSVDCNNPQESAKFINDIVKKDTNNQIKDIISPDSISKDLMLILIHTLHIKASWLNEFEYGTMHFRDNKGTKHTVESFNDDDKGVNLPFLLSGNITFVQLPLLGDCHLLIRHSAKSVQPITLADLDQFAKKSNVTLISPLRVPFVSMEETINLKQEFSEALPKILGGHRFKTDLFEEIDVHISDYIQKIKFDMTEDGIEASSVTSMMMESDSIKFPPKGSTPIEINSPFSFLLFQKIGKTNLPLFYGHVMDTKALKRIPI